MARPRKPTAVLEQNGAYEVNPGRRLTGEPVAEGEAVKPKFLEDVYKGRASQLWDEYAPVLAKMGTLGAADSTMFAAWCCLAAELEAGPERMQAARITQLRSLAESFGLTAAARAKMGVKGEGDKKDSDPAEQYFSGAGSGSPLRQ